MVIKLKYLNSNPVVASVEAGSMDTRVKLELLSLHNKDTIGYIGITLGSH